jgi:hypothetical protein
MKGGGLIRLACGCRSRWVDSSLKRFVNWALEFEVKERHEEEVVVDGEKGVGGCTFTSSQEVQHFSLRHVARVYF